MPRKLRARARRSATSALLAVATAALAASIFVTDILTPPDTAIAVLYVTVVLMAARFCRPRGVVLVAAGCFGLTVFCYFLSAENAFDTAIATLALGLTTFLALQSQSSAAALRDQASLLDLTHDAIIARRFDDDAITYWNHDAEELYGWDRAEAVGRVAHELVKTTYPLPLDQIKTELLRVGRFEGEFVNKRRDGTPVVVTSRWSLQRDRHGRPAVILVTSNDITERKRAEAEAHERERRYREMQMELEHANRIATMGQLTASIAHEVNQPIATARNNAASALRFLCRSPPDLEEVREALACIVNDVDRAGNVISGIRKLITKAPTPRDDSLDINEAIREVIVLTRGETLKNGVSVQMQLAEGLPLTHGDRVQLQQVVLNLVLNAVEAMAGAGKGPRELTIVSDVDDANDIVVEVRDTGPGINPADLDRLFQSFYTTKPDGIGMGLAICRSIVDAHAGRLWADANDPRGAVFQFTLPAGNTDL